MQMSMRQMDIHAWSSGMMSSVKKPTQAPRDLSGVSDAIIIGQGGLREQLARRPVGPVLPVQSELLGNAVEGTGAPKFPRTA